MGMTFLGDCVGWPHHDVHAPGGLTDMIDAARHVSRKTFLKRVLALADTLGAEYILFSELEDPLKSIPVFTYES